MKLLRRSFIYIIIQNDIIFSSSYHTKMVTTAIFLYQRKWKNVIQGMAIKLA